MEYKKEDLITYRLSRSQEAINDAEVVINYSSNLCIKV